MTNELNRNAREKQANRNPQLQVFHECPLRSLFQFNKLRFLPAYFAFRLNKNHRSITFVCSLAKRLLS